MAQNKSESIKRKSKLAFEGITSPFERDMNVEKLWKIARLSRDDSFKSRRKAWKS